MPEDDKTAVFEQLVVLFNGEDPVVAATHLLFCLLEDEGLDNALLIEKIKMTKSELAVSSGSQIGACEG